MIFIKTLMNADQIYTYLMELEVNLRIGPIIAIVKKLLTVAKANAFPPKKNKWSVPNLNKKCHSNMMNAPKRIGLA